MRDLFILGTAVHGLETAEIIERINVIERRWNLCGYLVTDEAKVGGDANGVPIVGTLDMLDERPDALCVPAYGFDVSLVPKERMATIVDPSAFVSRTATLGVGCVVYPNCFIGLNAKIGDSLFCLSGSVINHDDVLGDKVCVASNVSLAGGVRIGNGVYLGQACTVRQNVEIGENSLIGMGSVVVKDVEPDSVMVGNPARLLKKK